MTEEYEQLFHKLADQFPPANMIYNDPSNTPELVLSKLQGVLDEDTLLTAEQKQEATNRVQAQASIGVALMVEAFLFYLREQSSS